MKKKKGWRNGGENVKNRTRKKREMKNNSDQDQWKAGRRCGRKKERLENL